MEKIPLWIELGERIGAATGGNCFVVKAQHSVAGGCINKAYQLEGAGQRYFVKLNQTHYLPMFEAEATGLLELASSATVRVPQPICWGSIRDQAYLVLEYLALRPADETAMDRLGHQLAELHQTTHGEFGWRQDNTIGTTPQMNTLCADWTTFWRQRRLEPQLRWAAENGLNERLRHKGERLLERLPALFADHHPQPALVHGDLWSGNVASTLKQQPVLFDPAVYYGDRETDIAMTELFGGFSSRFYSAYGEVYPLENGYHLRRHLYNLYHILNHYNLFGGRYLNQAEQTMDALLVELN